jgi:hypothetical protein
MRLRHPRTLLLLCSVVVLLVAAPGAGAKPGYFVSQGYRSLGLQLQGSHGYRVTIVRLGRQVYHLLTGRQRSTVSYVTRSLGSRRSEIETRLPGLGRVSVRFRPQGPPERSNEPYPGCTGGKTVKQPGYFVGTIRFRGERGYTSVEAKRAEGTIETVGKAVCKRSALDEDDEPGGNEPGRTRVELFAFSRSKGRSIAFRATTAGRPASRPFARFSASASERRRGMKILRSTFAFGGSSEIVLGDTRPFPLSATVTPTGAFQGLARFRRDVEGGSTWTGSLSVPLPGLGHVRLSGPDFAARVCRYSGCTRPFVDGHRLPYRKRSSSTLEPDSSIDPLVPATTILPLR